MWRSDSLEKTQCWERLKTGREGDEGNKKVYGIINSMDMSLCKFQEMLTGKPGVLQSMGSQKKWTWLSIWTTTMTKQGAWRTMGKVHNIVQEAENKIIPKKNKFMKTKCLSEEALHSWRKKRSRRQGRKGKVHPMKFRVSENNKVRLEGLIQLTMQRNGVKQQKWKD